MAYRFIFLQKLGRRLLKYSYLLPSRTNLLILWKLQNPRYRSSKVFDFLCKLRTDILDSCLFPQILHLHILSQAHVGTQLYEISDIHLRLLIAKAFIEPTKSRNVAELHSSGSCKASHLLTESHKDVFPAGHPSRTPYFVLISACAVLIFDDQTPNCYL